MNLDFASQADASNENIFSAKLEPLDIRGIELTDVGPYTVCTDWIVDEFRTLAFRGDKFEFDGVAEGLHIISHDIKSAKKAHRAIVRKVQDRVFLESLKVGTVLVSSWGYDQTNVDFYVVTKVGPKSATIAPCGKETIINDGVAMTSKVIADATRLGAERFTKRSEKHEHGYLQVWDGRPQYCSHYA